MPNYAADVGNDNDDDDDDNDDNDDAMAAYRQ